MFGEGFWDVVWDIVRLLLIPVAAALAKHAIRWLAGKAGETDLGRRLQVINLAREVALQAVVEAENLFGGAKTGEEQVAAKEMAVARLSAWLKNARLDDYLSSADRSAVIEFVLAKVGLKSRRDQSRQPAIQPVVMAPPPPNGGRRR